MADTMEVPSRGTKFCPFAGLSISGDTVSGTLCLREKCQLWVPNNTTEGIAAVDKFARLTGDITDPQGETEHDDGGRCGAQTSDFMENLFRIEHHKHKSHDHPYVHSQCTDNFAPCGGTFYGSALPKSHQLASEFDSSEDADGNGKIFGEDFFIKGDNSPRLIKGLTESLATKPYYYVEWDDFKDGKYPPMLKSIYPNSVDISGGARIKIVGGFFSGDIESLTVKITDSSSLSINCTDINVVTNKILFCTIPALPVDYEIGKYDLEITNSGNTYDLEGVAGIIASSINSTGGTKTFNNVIDYIDTGDNTAIQDAIIADELTYE